MVGGTSAGCVSVRRALTLFLFAISSSAVVRTRLIYGKVGSGSGEASSKKSVTLAFRRLLYLYAGSKFSSLAQLLSGYRSAVRSVPRLG